MTDHSKPFRLIDVDDLDSDLDNELGNDLDNDLANDPGDQPTSGRRGEPSQALSVPADSHRSRRPGGRLDTEPVEKLDLNTATVEELEELPSVGPLRARRIIAWRARKGAFGALDDLRYVRGMGARSVEDLTPYVRVGVRVGVRADGSAEEDDDFRDL